MTRLLLLAATVAAADDVGVCWYRTAVWGPVRLLHDDGIGHHKSPRDRIALGRAACDRVNAAGNGTSGWRVVVSSGSRHGAAVLRETNALDEVVRPFATSVEAAAAALVARVKRSN